MKTDEQTQQNQLKELQRELTKAHPTWPQEKRAWIARQIVFAQRRDDTYN